MSEQRTDELVAIAASKEEANALREEIHSKHPRTWLLVWEPKYEGDSWELRVMNTWQGKLPDEKIAEITATCDALIDSRRKTVSAPPPFEMEVESKLETAVTESVEA